jgi:acetylornithine deacetylase/succinyl-diaminopimelate desuccinylase-like protein
MAIARPELEQLAVQERSHFEELLKDFVEIPSVSADPDRKADLERCAELGLSTIRAFGGHAEIHRIPGGPPVVLGSFGSGQGLTVTVYNHLDVVPASKETEPWRTEPFTFTREGDQYFGRGTTDDKGPALSALFGARAAVEAGVPLNIKLLWELEEEVGSPHFAETLRAIGPAAATDAVVVSDTVWVSRERPALSAGLRGLQPMTLRLETAETDQHSGTTGGVARNPVAELAQIASEIFDARTGRVKIPGFYDDVEKPTKEQIDGFRAAGFSIPRFKRVYDFKSIRTKDPLDAVKRLWAMPTFEVHGLVGGYVGPGVKTILTPRAELKVSMRLVPNMKGEKIVKLVKAFVKKRNPDIRVEPGPTAPAYKGVTRGPHVEAARRAMKFAFGRDPVLVREGGTIGAILFMEQILKCPIVFMGLSLPEHGYHAPNENYDWGQAAGGMAAFAKFFEEVSRPVEKVEIPVQVRRRSKGRS